MKKIKKIIVYMFITAGILMVGFSAVKYYLLYEERREIVKASEGLVSENFRDDNPVFIGDGGISDTGITVDNKSKEIKKTFNRDDYKSGMMIISIPKLKVKSPVIKGTSRSELKLGPGLYEKSELPDKENANVCIAGHRTTYGAWFRKVNLLNAGDSIEVFFDGNRYLYKVEKVYIVDNKDWSVTKPVGYSAITLTACHPVGSSKQRIVVRGKLESVTKA